MFTVNTKRQYPMGEVDKRVDLAKDEKIQIGRRFGKRLKQVAFDKRRIGKICELGLERHFYKCVNGGNPTLQSICLFAKIIGVHPKELFDFDENERILTHKDFARLSDYLEYKEKSKRK
jgi:hypothetical protein